MKLFKMILLFFGVVMAMTSTAQNVSINVLTQNSGQVSLGGTVYVEITVANTSTTTSVPVYKLRPQLSVPVSIVSIPATGHVLPSGWSIISNASGVIRVSNGTDQIPPNTARTILIAVKGETLGGPLTVSGNLLFSNGVAPGSASGPATPGDVTADNSSSSTVEVIPAPACSIAVSATAGSISCNGGTTTLTATATGANGAVEYSLNGGAFQSSNTFTVNAAGSPYTVTAREVSNTTCSANSSAVVVSEPSAISVSAAAGAIACNGGSTSLTVTATGGTGALQYSLNGGAFQSSNTFTVNAAGSPYTVTVQDANNCSAVSNSVTVSQPSAISASASAGSIACNGGTATLTVTATGGTGTLQYSINGGAYQAGNTFTVNAAGSPYTVTVKDANNCTAVTNSVTVNQPALLTASATSTPVSILGGSDGTATVTPAGGTSPYTFSWAPGAQTTAAITGLTAGSYTATVTDNNGCTATASTTVGSPSCNLSASASAGTIACNGGTTTLTVTATGGNGTLQYSLNGGAYQAGNTFTVNAAGSPYTVTVKDAGNCTANTNSVTVNQPSAISVSAAAGTIACNGGTTTLTVTATGGTGVLQYSINGGAYQAGNTFTVNAAGSPYTVTVKDDNNCSAVSNSVAVSQPSTLVASSTAGTAVCGGTGAVVVSATGGTAPYSGTGTFNVPAGPYSFTVTDANGCTSVTTGTVASGCSTNLTVTFAKTNLSACGSGPDGTITVTATGGQAPYVYSWTGVTGSNNTPFTAGNVSSLTGLNYGYYNVTVTDANSSVVTVSNIHVEFAFTVFVTSSGSNTSSCGNTGTILLYGNAGVQPYTYSIDGTTFQASNTFTGLAAGTYTGYVKDAAGCTSTKPNIVITAAAPVVASAISRPASSCANDGGVQVFRTGGIPPYTYSLDGTNFQSSSIFNNLAAGSYTATVKDSKGCTGTASVTVAQGAALTVTASKTNTSSCVNDGTIQVSAAGGVAPYTYSLNGITYQPANLFTSVAAGTYSVSVKDAKGCTGTVNVTISVNTIVVTSSVVNATSCVSGNGSIQLFRTGGVGPYMYSLNGNTYQASPVFTGLQAGTYTGYVKDSKNCVAIQSDIAVGPSGCRALPIATTGRTIIDESLNASVKAQAYPNPSATDFTLQLDGFRNGKGLIITVSDVLGRVVYQYSGNAKAQYKFGNDFKPGTYTVLIIQDNVRKIVKIVKS